MQLSRGVSIFMASAPLLLMGTVAITSRLALSPWTTPEYGPANHKAILAYVPLVRAVDDYQYRASQQAVNSKSGPDITGAISAWLTAIHSGELKPIPPAATADSGSDGVRGEIIQAKTRILYATVHYADESLRAGDRDTANKLLNEAVEISNCSKYMSLPSAEWSAQSQRRIVTEFGKLYAEANDAQKNEITASLRKIDVRPELLKLATIKQATYGSASDQQETRSTVAGAFSAMEKGHTRLIDLTSKAGHFRLGQMDVARQVLMALSEDKLLQQQIDQFGHAKPDNALIAKVAAPDPVL